MASEVILEEAHGEGRRMRRRRRGEGEDEGEVSSRQVIKECTVNASGWQKMRRGTVLNEVISLLEMIFFFYEDSVYMLILRYLMSYSLRITNI